MGWNPGYLFKSFLLYLIFCFSPNVILILELHIQKSALVCLKEVPGISTTLFASVFEKFVNSLQFLGDAPLTMAGIAEFKFESSAFAFVCFEISTLLKLEISTPLKLEISSFRRVENFKLHKG